MDETRLSEALHVGGPGGPHAEELQLFGQFIGSWDIDWSGVDAAGWTADGARRAALRLGARRPRRAGRLDRPGPRRAGRGAAAAGVPRLDDPLLRREDRRLALDLDRPGERPRPALHRAPGRRRHPAVSDEDEPQLRWRFTEITVRSFVWRGEISHDRGATWTLDEEMRITRR